MKMLPLSQSPCKELLASYKMCVRVKRLQNKKNEKLLKKNNYFPREGGGGGGTVPLDGKFHGNNFVVVVETFP